MTPARNPDGRVGERAPSGRPRPSVTGYGAVPTGTEPHRARTLPVGRVRRWARHGPAKTGAIALMALPTLQAVLVLTAWVALITGNPSLRAEDYPIRNIRVIVGPGPDLTARLLGAKITEALGQAVVIEPRPGAGGTIAAQTVAAAPPDGYTLLLASAAYTINTAMQQGPFDLRRDFAPIALITTSPFVLVVHPSVPARTVAELIAYAKANPGRLNYASSGIGTPPHLAGEMFKVMAGVDIVHVPFREANSGINAVVGGVVQMMFSIASTASAQIAGGTVRGIAVTSRHPSPVVPGLPAVADQGLAGFDVVGWNGFVAPKGTPAAIVDKLNAALRRGIADDDVGARLAVAGYEMAVPATPAAFAAFIEADTAKWSALVEKTRKSP
jgi:tripartite-type tricarboxylate transporter receptor subunit TctC